MCSLKQLEVALRDCFVGWLKVELNGSTFSEALECPWHSIEGRHQRLSEVGRLERIYHTCPGHPLPHLVPKIGSEDTPCSGPVKHVTEGTPATPTPRSSGEAELCRLGMPGGCSH